MILLALLPALALLLWLRHWMYHVEPRRIETTRHEVFFRDLPAELDGFTICQVSDPHITARGRNAREIADAIRGVRADLYALTGDMIFRQSGIAAFFRWFDELGEAIRPAIAVLGNAENKEHVRTEEVLRGLSARGVPVLNNSVYCFTHVGSGAQMQIVGVDDPHTEQSDFDRAYADADPGAWTLLLCHSPDGLADMGGRRADLILCGHTHGGQIRLPLIGALAHNTSRVRRIISGWYCGSELNRRARADLGNAQVYVSRGLGVSGFQGRLFCPPELAMFTLRREAIRGVNSVEKDA